MLLPCSATFVIMKHLTILMVTLIMLVKPLWPIMEYVANYDYITNVLCENKDTPQLQCNGKCYLAKQLRKEQKDQDKNPFGENTSKTEIQSTVYFQSIATIGLVLWIEHQAGDNFSHYQNFRAFLFTKDIPHPPEQA